MRGEPCKYGNRCHFEHDRATTLVNKIVGYPGLYGSAIKFIEISYVGEFESFGRHETWGYGWYVKVNAIQGRDCKPYELPEPVQTSHVHIDGALEEALRIIEERGYPL